MSFPRVFRSCSGTSGLRPKPLEMCRKRPKTPATDRNCSKLPGAIFGQLQTASTVRTSPRRC
eukprot:12312281-Alexandrium_andersonii.AAC.1